VDWVAEGPDGWPGGRYLVAGEGMNVGDPPGGVARSTLAKPWEGVALWERSAL
jgi:hypothetical protein